MSPSPQPQRKKIDWSKAPKQEHNLLANYSIQRYAYGGGKGGDRSIANTMNKVAGTDVLEKVRAEEYTKEMITEAYAYMNGHKEWKEILKTKRPGKYTLPEQRRVGNGGSVTFGLMTSKDKVTSSRLAWGAVQREIGERVKLTSRAGNPNTKRKQPANASSMAESNLGGLQSTRPQFFLPPLPAKAPSRGAILISHGNRGSSQHVHEPSMAGLSISGVQQPNPLTSPPQDNMAAVSGKMGEPSNVHGQSALRLPSLKSWNRATDPTEDLESKKLPYTMD
jgi:hypothetical protein